jgi:hypothetical protein
MSEWARRCSVALCAVAVVAVVAVVAGGRTARAQSADPLDAHRHAVMSAKAGYDAAIRRYAADSVRRMRLQVVRNYAGLEARCDTANVEPRLLRALDSTFASVLAEARTLFGASADTLLGGIHLTISAAYPTAQLQRAGGVASRVTLQYDGGGGSGYADVSARPVDAAALALHFDMWFGRAAARRMPPALTRWASDHIPVRVNDAEVNRNAYILLATYPSSVARACLDGSHAGCRASLAIVAGGDTIGLWLDANARRARVRQRTERVQQLAPDVRRCLNEGSDVDCRAVLQHVLVPSPTIGDTRQNLIRSALIKGGPGAFQRLADAQGDDVVKLLEIAGGVPFDSLVDEWRAGVLAARSPSPAPNGKELTIALSVGVLAIGLASRRRP